LSNMMLNNYYGQIDSTTAILYADGEGTN
jgi:hypothetical protein